MQEQKKRNGSRRKTAKRKPGKYAGYIRITALALVFAIAIIAFDSLRRNSSPKGKPDIIVHNTDQDLLPDEEDTPDVTGETDDTEPYEKKEIDENDFRPVVKTRAELAVGSLVMVNRQNAYSFPNVSANMVNISSNIKDRHFKVSYNTLQLQ